MTDKRVAVVTGGGSGMGRAICHRLARDGFSVAILDLNAESAAAVAEEIREEGNEATPIGGVDVSDRAQVDAAIQRVRTELGPVLVLVNNAGITGFREFLSITDEKWDRIMAVNLNGPFYCTQAALPDMIEAGWGRIVNISSSSAQGGQSHMVHYVSSKAGVIGFTKALALEFGPHGITVNTIPPGFIDTPMLRVSEEKGMLGASVDHHAELTPVRRAGLPEDIAAACAFLVSDDAGYITGQIIGVNGGREHLMVKAADQFHAGVVVDDLDAAMTWLADACGYRWCQEVRLEILFVTPRAETNLSLRVTYSMDEPHLELVEAVPGTLFTPSTTNLHHLGFWSDDIDGDVAALEAVGGSLEGKGYPRTGDEPSWAFVKAPDGPLIELVASTAKPWMDRWWATGLPR